MGKFKKALKNVTAPIAQAATKAGATTIKGSGWVMGKAADVIVAPLIGQEGADIGKKVNAAIAGNQSKILNDWNKKIVESRVTKPAIQTQVLIDNLVSEAQNSNVDVKELAKEYANEKYATQGMKVPDWLIDIGRGALDGAKRGAADAWLDTPQGQDTQRTVIRDQYQKFAGYALIALASLGLLWFLVKSLLSPKPQRRAYR